MTRNIDSNPELSLYIDGCNEPAEKVSLIHTTDMLSFDGIMSKNQLHAIDDKFYKSEDGPDKLLYLFYGRPSYRVHPDVRNTKVSAFAPVCFVFKKDFAAAIKRMHAFDTGAYFTKRMTELLHPSFDLTDFKLPEDYVAAQKLISTFYGSNANYIDCRPKNIDEADDFSKRRMRRVETYYQLIRHNKNDGLDERIHAIEVQSEDDIALEDNLLAVVMPTRFFDKVDIEEIERKWKCAAVGYHVKEIFSPVELMDLIFDKVREVLLQDDQLS